MLKASRSGIEAMATGEWHPVLAPHCKLTWGLVDGHRMYIRWDTRGAEHNLPWQVEAVRRYQESIGR